MSWLKSKIKMVALKASDALAQAADIVAPTLYESRVEEFHHRWQTVARFLESILHRDVDPSEQRRLLLESHTRDSLQKLVLLIYAEETACDRMEVSISTAAASFSSADQEQQPRECLEYLLEKQIIPHLCDVGQRDQPSGIMSLAMQFVGALLSRVSYPILPTREVHVSVVALLQAATKREIEDPVVRKCLINLLNTLWKKLRQDPVQTEFFFLQATNRLRIHKTGGSGPTSDYALQASDSESHQVADFVLFTALLPHMFALGKDGEKCREALVIAASVHEPALCRFILNLTPFCHYVVNGIISAFDALPKTLPVELSKRQQEESTKANDEQSLENELGLLMIRLRFCCTLAMVGRYELHEEEEEENAMPMSITNELLTQFRARFLHGPLLEGLLDTSEAVVRTMTVYARIILEELAACGSTTEANPLLLVFVQFLLTREQAEENEKMQRLSHEVVHRMDALSPSVSIVAMDLMISLLEVHDPVIDKMLVGASQEMTTTQETRRPSHESSAMWFASRFPQSTIASFAHVWKLQGFRGHANDVEASLAAGSAGEDSSDDQMVSLLSYIADAEYLACRCVRSEGSDTSDSESEEEEEDEEQELDVVKEEGETPLLPTEAATDGDRQCAETIKNPKQKVNETSWKPKTLKDLSLSLSMASYSPVPTRFQSTVASTQEEAHDQHTILMRLVLHRLERLLESSLQENLALSGLVSAVAHKPLCQSFVFDLNEQLPTGQSIRSVLEDVYGDAVRRISRLPNGRLRVHEMRRQLMKEVSPSSLDAPETRVLVGFIVLEELLKELCALLFANERLTRLPLKPEGYYLEPKRPPHHTLSSISPSLSCSSMASSGSTSNLMEPMETTGPPPQSIGNELEQLIAEAESTMSSLLVHESS